MGKATGFALCQKRLAKGGFEFPKVIGVGASVEITATDLALILGGVAPTMSSRERDLIQIRVRRSCHL